MNFDEGLIQGMKINSGSRSDVVLHSTGDKRYAMEEGKEFQGTFGVISEIDGKFQSLYIGKGIGIRSGNYGLESKKAQSAGLNIKDGKYIYSASGEIKVILPIPKDIDESTLLLSKLAYGYFGVMVPPVSVKQCHFERYCNYIKKLMLFVL